MKENERKERDKFIILTSLINRFLYISKRTTEEKRYLDYILLFLFQTIISSVDR